jgi:predicted DNA-binding transcriptional regulator AlpA
LPQRRGQQKQFVQLVEEGHVRTLTEAARILGVTPATVYNYAKQTGVTIQSKTGRRRDAQAEFVQLVEQGRVSSLIEAATILGVSRQTIYKYAQQTGVTLKGRTGRAVGWRSPRTRQITDQLRQLVDDGQVNSKTEAARLLGTTRGRVHELAAEAGITVPWRPRLRYFCTKCGTERREQPPEDLICHRCRHAKVPVACPSCGNVRLLPPCRVRVLKSQTCRRCWLDDLSRRAIESQRTTCEKCGRTRLIQRSEARLRATGLCQPCYLRSTKQEREAARRRQATQRRTMA